MGDQPRSPSHIYPGHRSVPPALQHAAPAKSSRGWALLQSARKGGALLATLTGAMDDDAESLKDGAMSIAEATFICDDESDDGDESSSSSHPALDATLHRASSIVLTQALATDISFMPLFPSMARKVSQTRSVTAPAPAVARLDVGGCDVRPAKSDDVFNIDVLLTERSTGSGPPASTECDTARPFWWDTRPADVETLGATPRPAIDAPGSV